MSPGKAGKVHVGRADDVERLHGRIVDLLSGVSGDGGEWRPLLGVVEGEGPFGEVGDGGDELRGHRDFGKMEPAKAGEYPRVEDMWFGEDIQGCVCAKTIGVGGDVVLARAAAQFLNGGDEDGVGVGGRVSEGGVNLKRSVEVSDEGVAADDVLLQRTFDAGVNG